MPTAVSIVLSIVALGLAVLAIVLATIANRRWVRRMAGPEGDAGAGPAARPRAEGEGQLPETSPGAGDRGRAADRQPLVALQGSLADLREHVAVLAADLDGLHAQVAEVAGHIDAPRSSPTVDPTALRHVALVRYDAFADVGGRLSYSVAVLDDTRSGLVLTTLAGKADVRTYVRTVSAGAPDGTLTAEEQQAVEAAVGSRP